MMIDVLDITLACCQDPTVGLKAQIDALIALGAPEIRTDFGAGKWVIAQKLRDARTPSYVIRPKTGADQIAAKQTGWANGAQEIEFAAEYFDADPEKRQDAIAVMQAGFLRVLFNLVEYSQSHGGTIEEAVSPAITTYGEFQSPPSATGSGFITQFTILERNRMPS